ncbi:preprotein translocase subunit YajC [Anaerosalibacter sp. Marseille-P3206]|uniref:preprotein translocase subunit YajC n=1 Tax=Anaerosalibacter sp. Marseille-P3206 TaxID=1871005 RepID=UPI001F29B143|nr:preprotein translocase subunit YajC [Anaerosalibacter sp. Marseille-P3206]
MQGFQSIIMLVVFFLILYFLTIRPQQKREKQIREMRDSLNVGDEIITIGGIFGKVIKVKEDMVSIEVGSDKTRFDITKWAVGSVINKKELNKEDNKKDSNQDKNEEK